MYIVILTHKIMSVSIDFLIHIVGYYQLFLFLMSSHKYSLQEVDRS